MNQGLLFDFHLAKFILEHKNIGEVDITTTLKFILKYTKELSEILSAVEKIQEQGIQVTGLPERKRPTPNEFVAGLEIIYSDYGYSIPRIVVERAKSLLKYEDIWERFDVSKMSKREKQNIQEEILELEDEHKQEFLEDLVEYYKGNHLRIPTKTFRLAKSWVQHQ